MLDATRGGKGPINAPRLGLDLRTVEAIALSHGHVDHTGGLAGVLKTIGKHLPVYAHPDIFSDRYGLSHCTGLHAGAYLARELGPGLVFCTVGYSAHFE
ncbi:MAG TPA: MBL fold metallo-hydrolase [Candidatus Sulfotelmatobacter sp.]|nr:MBL fold metallo-hydrolase [Candidatus Sulfotelmatobacter sp.]